MKYSVSSYSFSRAGIPELDLPAKAKSMGFDAIEFAEIHNGDMDKAEYAGLLRQKCDEVGIEISNYAIGANFLYGSDGDLDAEVERLCREVDIASILGVPTMRHDAAWDYNKDDRAGRGFDNALPRIIEGCRRVTEYAETKGIKTMIENHGQFIQEATRVEKVVTGVAHPNFGLLLDMGNFLCADDDPAKAFGRLAPFGFYVHAKDFHVKSGDEPAPQNGFFTTRAGNYLRGAIIGHGNVPVYRCLKILKNNGYDGYVSVEFEGMEDPITAIKYGLENLKFLGN